MRNIQEGKNIKEFKIKPTAKSLDLKSDLITTTTKKCP